MENLDPKELYNLATERLEDAKVLLEATRCDGAFYICGYAVELGLKYAICKTLGWEDYPASGKGSDKYKSFKTHDFEVLLHLSGREKQIKKEFLPEWSILMKWNSETRYSSQVQTFDEVGLMIKATETLLNHIWNKS